MKQFMLHPRSSLSAEDLLFSETLPGYPVGRLEQKVAVTVGAKALGRLGREIAGLPRNASCTPWEKRGEYFFEYMVGWEKGKIPLNRIEDAILSRLSAGAASFQVTVSGIEWRKVQFRVQMVVQLTRCSKN